MFVRIGISAALLFLVLKQVPFGEVLSAFTRISGSWSLVIVAGGLPGLGLIVAGLRWKVLLRGQGVQVPLIEIVWALLVGAFFNQIVPSTIAGDVVRSRRVARLGRFGGDGGTIVSLAVVAVDRVLGLLGICMLALFVAVINPGLARQIHGFWAVVALLSMAILGCGLLFTRIAKLGMNRKFKSVLLSKVRDKARIIYDASVEYRKTPMCLVVAFFWSVVLQLLIICQYTVLSQALGVGLSISELAMIVPIVTLVSLLPISINGIGLRESALAVLGSSFGLTVANAVAMGWLEVGFKIIYSLVGGFRHLYDQHGAMMAERAENNV